MLRIDRSTPLSVEAATELRDALSRRQKELPARWLAMLDAEMLADDRAPVTGHALEPVERTLGLALLRDHIGDARPRSVVCLHPSASAANADLVAALCDRGCVTAIATAELDATLATRILARITPAGARRASAALACDWTVDLPVPDPFPRPRVYLALGNTLGRTTAVGAVRMLRVVRSTMNPGDHIILGLDARRHETEQSPAVAAVGAVGAVAAVAADVTDVATAAARDFRALELVNATAGAAFDPGRFEFRPTFDAENCRLETHLVARKALEVRIPGVCDVRFKKGESIRTSVSSTFDRTRVSAMLAGVGLTLRQWTTDPESRVVVALASPAA